MIIIRVAGHNPDLDPIKEFITETFPCCELQEQHHNMVQYQLGDETSLAKIFSCMEGVREQYEIEDYSVSQTTLDQVRFTCIHFILLVITPHVLCFLACWYNFGDIELKFCIFCQLPLTQ